VLEIDELAVSYGAISALRGVSLRVDEGETVGVIGPNGAGKSTLMMAVCGVLTPGSGSIRFEGQSLAGRTPESIVRSGIALVPEARFIFGSLTVRENLQLGATVRKDKAAVAEDVERMLEVFPPLRRYFDAPANGLSGGEQQMLAIARALLSRPRLLLLDEPSLGLSPVMTDQVFAVLADLKAAGTTMLLVEQNARRTLGISDRVYALQTGQVRAQGTSAELSESAAFESLYLGGL
jgi:branched-chain amino acid transport system ATP-binding protein